MALRRYFDIHFSKIMSVSENTTDRTRGWKLVCHFVHFVNLPLLKFYPENPEFSTTELRKAFIKGVIDNYKYVREEFDKINFLSEQDKIRFDINLKNLEDLYQEQDEQV